MIKKGDTLTIELEKDKEKKTYTGVVNYIEYFFGACVGSIITKDKKELIFGNGNIIKTKKQGGKA